MNKTHFIRGKKHAELDSWHHTREPASSSGESSANDSANGVKLETVKGQSEGFARVSKPPRACIVVKT
jgi:hypothetical protein